jgi:L-asparagine transporter-like permease
MPSVLFGFLLSGFMTLIVSGVSTAHTMGVRSLMDAPGRFVGAWLSAYLFSWIVAFPTVLVVGPRVRRFISHRFQQGNEK